LEPDHNLSGAVQVTTSTGIDQLSALSERSNKLGLDRSIANFGGGNTSAKTREPDHTGREVDVLWVKGSGSDLATIGKSDFTGLRLEDLLLLRSRSTMSDEEMVDYLVRCQLHPAMPRPSIETLLHAFLPYPHVDHTHPDAINVFSCTADGERLARECFGAEMVWTLIRGPVSAWRSKSVRRSLPTQRRGW
jgi:rhamnose utilization protein RhaD (predicted bifunctional aldolase and dehydrogenase)